MRGTLPTTQNLPPEVFFSWTGTCSGDTTCFINQTIRANTYTWTITDTSTVFPFINTLFISSRTNICFHFPAPGTYSVSLHAYNNHDVTLTKIIKIGTVTKAAFSFVRCANQFTNNSLCATSFFWNFGDGNTSTEQFPVHQYAATGSYNVSLIAKNGIKSDTSKQAVYINEISFVSTAFSYTVAYDTVFVHANYSTPANFYWNFGDPVNLIKNYATGRDTFHVYKDSMATYNIGLTAINQCGPFFGNDSIKINLLPSRLTFKSNLAIVPNPTDGDNINVYYNSYNAADYLAQVFNSLGEMVFEEYFSFGFGINGFKFSTFNLNQGAYILVLQSEGTYARRKFLVGKKP